MLIREAYRTLKKGGELKLRTPNFLSVNTTLDPTHKHAFTFFAIRKMLKHGKFTIMLEYKQVVDSPN